MASTETHPKTSNEEEDCLFAMQLASASILPMVMQAAIQLDVLEIIARTGPGAFLSPTEIASQLHTQNPDAPIMLDRILRLLASYSILTYSLITHDDGQVERLYGLAPVCKYFLRNQDGVSVGSLMFFFQDKVAIESWYKLKDAVLQGGVPFNMVHGMNTFEYLGKDPRFNQVFNTAMFSHTTITMKKILQTYKGFEDLKELVDVGGGVGITLNMIISKYPKIKGINFDLPHVIEHAPSYPGVEHVEGDMFASLPKGEAIFLKAMLHGWTDDRCLKLLKNCYEAIPDHGKVIVMEEILPVAPETTTAAKSLFQKDLIMMTQAPGGKERTQQEFVALAKRAGFTRIRFVCCAFNNWVMEFHKNM